MYLFILQAFLKTFSPWNDLFDKMCSSSEFLLKHCDEPTSRKIREKVVELSKSTNYIFKTSETLSKKAEIEEHRNKFEDEIKNLVESLVELEDSHTRNVPLSYSAVNDCLKELKVSGK